MPIKIYDFKAENEAPRARRNTDVSKRIEEVKKIFANWPPELPELVITLDGTVKNEAESLVRNLKLRLPKYSIWKASAPDGAPLVVISREKPPEAAPAAPKSKKR